MRTDNSKIFFPLSSSTRVSILSNVSSHTQPVRQERIGVASDLLYFDRVCSRETPGYGI